MASLEQAKVIAKEIQDILGPNHVSTMVYGHFLDDVIDNVDSTIPMLIVVKKFDETTSLKIYKVLKQWMKHGIEVPYVAELDDLSGMLDSIPNKLMDIKARYQVLQGEDLLELRAEPEFEYLRAQVELELRRNIYNLRHDLLEVMLRRIPIDRYMKNAALTCLSSIKAFHAVTRPDITSNNQHLEYFYREFPAARDPLRGLLEMVYSKQINTSEKDLLDLLTKVIDEVIQPMLIKVDNIGKEIIDHKLKRVEDIVEAKTREMRLELVKEKMKLVKQRKEISAYEGKKLDALSEQKKDLEKQMLEIEKKKKEVQAPTPRVVYPENRRYYSEYEEFYPEREPPKPKKEEVDDLPRHEKELNVFEKILYENKTLKNTIKKQVDPRKSV